MTPTQTAEAPIPQAASASSKTPIVYFDGRYIQKSEVLVSPDDRGFLLGDGIYEVAAAYDGRFIALDRHMDRLRRSLDEAKIDSAVADPLETVFQELLERNGFAESGKSMVYLQVTRGVAPRSHAFPKPHVRPTVYAYAAPFPSSMADLENGAGAITCKDVRWSRCDIKTISLIANCMANQEAKEAGAFEAILVRDGIALEGSHTSLFGIVNGEVRTAPLSNLILPGITRELVIEAMERDGMSVVLQPLTAEEVDTAEELFITGTTTEVVPLTTLNGRKVGDGTPGPVTKRIQALYRSHIGV